MKPNIDYSLYLVTDRNLMSTATLTVAVEQAIQGGCTLVQLREKELNTKNFLELAISVKEITDKYGIPLIINDRIDVMLAVNADGVHIGSGDMPPAIARNLIGKDKILGVSARTVEEAVLAEIAGADYLGVGAMFATNTKTDAMLVSCEELKKIRSACTIPLVVIGGINKGNIHAFDDIAIDGISVVSAVLSAPDIVAAAQELNSFVKSRKIVSANYVVDGVEWAIFDLDGTLLDSMDLWERIDVEFLSKRGYEVPPNYINEISARNFKEAAIYTKDLFGLSEQPEELIEIWREMAQMEYAKNIRLKPYVKEYLCALKMKEIRLAVATSLPPSLFEPVLKNNGIYDMFDKLFSAEDVSHGKESPDFYYYVIDRLAAKADNCLIFEDVLQAMQSAKKTGATICAVYDFYSKNFISKILEVSDIYITDFTKAPLINQN